MIIETANGKQQEATPARISEILGSGDRRGDFVILSRGDQFYLQAWIAEEPCQVEYRDGSDSSHFSANHKFSIPELEALMLRYLEEVPDWGGDYEWTPLSEQKSPPNPSRDTSWDISWS